MVNIKTGIELNAEFTLTISEHEANALYALTAYGHKQFLEVFYKNLGKSALEVYETGLISLFESIASEFPKHIKKVKEVRKFINKTRNEMAEKIIRDAFFSNDRKYRYYLYRIWDKSKERIMFIGLNPSTADEFDDDPTIRRCIGFAKSWGYGGMYMTNLYCYVSTDPDKIEKLDQDGDNFYLKTIANLCKNNIVFCWGAFKKHKERMKEIIEMFPNALCIGISKYGYPKHPLYLKGNLKPINYESILLKKDS